jgi:hypothetical protein
MSLILACGVWLFLIGFVYRAHRRSGSVGERRKSGDSDVAVGFGSTHEVPDTVPSDWVETYRSEHGG